LLGILIVSITVLAWGTRRSPWLATAIVAVVVFQATLGKWTVTMLLKPAIVSAHLLGGMTMLALLTWLALAQWSFSACDEARTLRVPALAAIVVLAIQIALGGWVSANYAALACPDLPGCVGALVPPMDFANAFHVLRELGRTGEGELLPREALTAIHWTHRMFALVVVSVIGWCALRTVRVKTLRGLGLLVAALVVLQFSLGVANVALGLPLTLAAAHNGGAALLVIALVVLNFFSLRGLRPHW
jgi:cytochrome c oxidase assembly protein subunit 15